jgi:hypothetical protein
VHRGILLTDSTVPINVDLIVTIIGIPMDEEKLEQYMEDKNKAEIHLG